MFFSNSKSFLPILFILFSFLEIVNAEEISQTKFSQEITVLIDKKLAENNLVPNAPIDDATFVRRIYLDLIGRIPTHIEYKDFMDSINPDKRAILIDQLLESPGYVSHNFNYWSDVLRITSRLKNLNGQPYINWLKENIKKNTPYNQMVSELLTSHGSLYAEGNGAVGYYFRDPGMPLDNLANSMQIFLGTSMVCAQCHDHPFAKWTQLDFYKLAAFTAGTEAKRSSFDRKDPEMKPLMDIREEERSNIELKKASDTFMEALYSNVSHKGTGMIRLPHDFKEENGKPFDIIQASVPFGISKPLVYPKFADIYQKTRDKYAKSGKNMPIPGEDINSRSEFAAWVTAKENPLFTKVIVNRMWHRFMGAVLVGPLVNIEEKAMGDNPELTAALINQMQKINFDLKEFTRIIVNSTAYQRQANTTDQAPLTKLLYTGPQLHRLSAEQIWDSLLTLSLENPDARLPKKLPKSGAEKIYAKYHSTPPAELAKVIREASVDRVAFAQKMEKEGGAGNSGTEMEMSMNMGMMNENSDKMNKDKNTDINKLSELSDRELKKLLKEVDDTYLSAKNFQKEGKKEAAKEHYAKAENLRKESNILREKTALIKHNNRTDLMRASELISPAPTSHFLRRFGQSEREIIDGNSQEASIPQALTLLNGQVENELINNSVSKINLLLRLDGNAKRINVAYEAILSRPPTEKELSFFMDKFTKNSSQAQKDLIWVLVNSNEFLFKK